MPARKRPTTPPPAASKQPQYTPPDAPFRHVDLLAFENNKRVVPFPVKLHGATQSIADPDNWYVGVGPLTGKHYREFVEIIRLEPKRAVFALQLLNTYEQTLERVARPAGLNEFSLLRNWLDDAPEMLGEEGVEEFREFTDLDRLERMQQMLTARYEDIRTKVAFDPLTLAYTTEFGVIQGPANVFAHRIIAVLLSRFGRIVGVFDSNGADVTHEAHSFTVERLITCDFTYQHILPEELLDNFDYELLDKLVRNEDDVFDNLLIKTGALPFSKQQAEQRIAEVTGEAAPSEAPKNE